MKKMISCLAVLTLLASVPVTAVYAADTAPVVLTEAADSAETEQAASVNDDYSEIAGTWEEIDGEKRIFKIEANGTYTAIYPDGEMFRGSIKIGNEMFSDNTDSLWYNFYNQDGRAWIGFRKSDSGMPVNELKEGELTLRRKTERDADTLNEYGFYLADDIPSSGISVSALEGFWMKEENGESLMFFDCTGFDGNFQILHEDNTLSDGYVKLEYSVNDDNSRSYWYNLYTYQDKYVKSFFASGNLPLDVINAGQEGADEYVRDKKMLDKETVAADKMNDLNAVFAILGSGTNYTDHDSTFGDYVKVTDSRFECISDLKLFISNTCTGELRDDLIRQCEDCCIDKDGSLYVRKAAHSFFEFHTYNGVSINPAMNKFTATAKEGDALYGFGRASFVFEDNNWYIDSYSFDIFDDTFNENDLADIADYKINDLEFIYSILSGGLGCDNNDTITVNGKKYARVNEDQRISSLEDIKRIICATCSGSFCDDFIRDADEFFIEKNGVLYTNVPARGGVSFNTDQGLIISDASTYSFSATTAAPDAMFGLSKVDFVLESAEWHINGWSSVDVQNEDLYNDNHDISEITGTWNEADVLDSRTLIIREDSTFTLIYRGGGAMYGTVTPHYEIHSDGSSSAWFNLYANNGEFITGFAAPSQLPCNDLYSGTDGSMHFIRQVEPEHKYSDEELREMAAADYEKKTGIRPASTHSMVNSDGSVTIVMQNENNEDFDAYTVDPDTGIGEMFSDKSTVTLPQTGNNSPKTAAAAAAAVAFTLTGIYAAAKSGVLRKKEENE